MALGDPGDTPHHIPGNLPPSALGGDNRGDLGHNRIPGNPDPGSVMPHDYGWPGDEPCFKVPGSASPDEVRSMFGSSG